MTNCLKKGIEREEQPTFLKYYFSKTKESNANNKPAYKMFFLVSCEQILILMGNVKWLMIRLGCKTKGWLPFWTLSYSERHYWRGLDDHHTFLYSPNEEFFLSQIFNSGLFLTISFFSGSFLYHDLWGSTGTHFHALRFTSGFSIIINDS